MAARMSEIDNMSIASLTPGCREGQPNKLSVITLNSAQMLGDHVLGLEARRLRASVYIDQHGFLPSSAKEDDGGEHDEDDERSVHFVAVEDDSLADQKVVGTMRLIHKQGRTDPLPIELFFPEYFEQNPVYEDGFEVSRLVVEGSHGKATNRLASFCLIQAGLQHALTEAWSPCFAVLEPSLERRLRAMGVKTDRVTDAKWVEQYNTSNIGVEIDLGATKNGMQKIEGLSR